MKKRRYPIILLISVLVLLLLGGRFIFSAKLSLSNALGGFFEKLSPYSDLRIQLAELQKENENLKAKLFAEESGFTSSIPVYSSYPFNNRSEIAIAAGSNQGISEGSVVTYGDSILIGRVKTVAPNLSIVTTIFDPGFETAVRIGQGAVDALLEGGNKITLDLIAADASIEDDSIVFTASAEFPYGLEVGRITNIRGSEGGVFKKADLEPAFEIKALRDVVVRP